MQQQVDGHNHETMFNVFVCKALAGFLLNSSVVVQ
jgi:hypothetical protein